MIIVAPSRIVFPVNVSTNDGCGGCLRPQAFIDWQSSSMLRFYLRAMLLALACVGSSQVTDMPNGYWRPSHAPHAAHYLPLPPDICMLDFLERRSRAFWRWGVRIELAVVQHALCMVAKGRLAPAAACRCDFYTSSKRFHGGRFDRLRLLVYTRTVRKHSCILPVLMLIICRRGKWVWQWFSASLASGTGSLCKFYTARSACNMHDSCQCLACNIKFGPCSC